MKMTPPWSRRRCTHPIRSTVLPSSEARSWPQVWVRRRSPKKSSRTVVSICRSLVVIGKPRGDLVARQLFLLAGSHVLQRVAALCHLVVADDQREFRAELVG